MSQFLDQIELSSSLDCLSKIEAFISRFYGNNDHIEDSYGNILIALTEGVNNAIFHGNKNDPSKVVLIHMEVAESEVVFTIEDQGNGFDYNAVPDPTLPENLEKLNGRGIFLMRNLADAISFENNGTRVKLKFTYINS
jgi:serine/threonine-protein kinase RsbW